RAPFPSGSPTQTFIHPVRSQTKARASPPGGKRGCPQATPSPPATTWGGPVAANPSTPRTTIREASHGMSGKSHSCQTRVRPSGAHAGSKAQSAPAERRAGHADPSVGTTAMSQVSSRSSTKGSRPSGEKRGPASPRDRATMAAVTAYRSRAPSMVGRRYRRPKVVSPLPNLTSPVPKQEAVDDGEGPGSPGPQPRHGARPGDGGGGNGRRSLDGSG